MPCLHFFIIIRCFCFHAFMINLASFAACFSYLQISSVSVQFITITMLVIIYFFINGPQVGLHKFSGKIQSHCQKKHPHITMIINNCMRPRIPLRSRRHRHFRSQDVSCARENSRRVSVLFILLQILVFVSCESSSVEDEIL